MLSECMKFFFFHVLLNMLGEAEYLTNEVKLGPVYMLWEEIIWKITCQYLRKLNTSFQL